MVGPVKAGNGPTRWMQRSGDNWRESSLDSATALLEAMMDDG